MPTDCFFVGENFNLFRLATLVRSKIKRKTNRAGSKATLLSPPQIPQNIGYSNDTTCIQTHNLDLIQESIISIFKEEGYLQISKPSLPENNKLLIKEFLARPYLIRSLIIIGLLSNDSDWATIKTSSPKLFCYRAKNFAHLILSELAVQCSSQAFHYHIQKRNCGVLLKVDTAGKILASGYMDYDEAGRMKFLNVPVIKTTKEQNFFLLKICWKYLRSHKRGLFISSFF
ncbi:MAG: hypothetical protein QNJ55_10920 [Xenococcus sp. MO_188.B8]|nr:hypothetical protein [Xenococcus sp. MO_188.B8]